MKRGLIILFVVILFFLEFVVAECVTLEPGYNYIYENTELCPQTYNIEIRVANDNIVLDCNGSILQGNHAGQAISASSRNNLTIKNCDIRDYDMGIFLTDTSNSLIINNNLSNFWNSGENDGYAICLYGLYSASENNIIRDNEVYDSFVALYSANVQHTVYENNVFERSTYGAYMTYSPGNEQNNSFYSNFLCNNGMNDIDNIAYGYIGDYNTCDLASGWSDEGTTGCTYACPAPQNTPPTRGSCTASIDDLAVGRYYQKQNITCTYYDEDGYDSLRWMYLLINYKSNDSSSCDNEADVDCGGIIGYMRYLDVFGKARDFRLTWGNPLVTVDNQSSAYCTDNYCDVSFVFYYETEDFLTDNNDARIVAFDNHGWSTAPDRGYTVSPTSAGLGTDNLFDTHIGSMPACVFIEEGMTSTIDFSDNNTKVGCLSVPNHSANYASIDFRGIGNDVLRDSYTVGNFYTSSYERTLCRAFTPSEDYIPRSMAYSEYTNDVYRSAKLSIRETNPNNSSLFVGDAPSTYCDIYNARDGWISCDLNNPQLLSAGTKYWACISDLGPNCVPVASYEGGVGIAAWCDTDNYDGSCDNNPTSWNYGINFRIFSQDYPNSLTIDVGDDSDIDWNYTGELQTSVTYNDSSFFSEINDYLIYHEGCEDPCIVPMIFTSNTPGAMEIFNFEYLSTTSCGNADSDSDGSVSITEIINYITQWKSGEITITELISGIGEWKNGC